MARPLNLAMVQLDARAGDSREDRIVAMTEQVATLHDADLVMLPEMWAIGYFSFDTYEEGAESLDGETLEAVRHVARELGAWVHGGSFVERDRDGHLFNTSILVDAGGSLVHSYRKAHLFGYGSRESELLTAGRTVESIRTDLGHLALATCYDLRFPEMHRRMLADQAAELLLVCSAWPAARADHWDVLTQCRAVENLAFVAACNEAGVDNGVEMGGRSTVVDPWGRRVVHGSQEPVVRARFDLDDVAATRAEFPSLNDRWMGLS